MSWENTKEYVLAMMGYPSVSVEITDKQLDICMRDACDRWFEYNECKIKYHYFTMNPSTNIYDLPEDAKKMTAQGLKFYGVIAQPSNFEAFQYFFQFSLYNYTPLQVSNIYMLFQNLETFLWATGQNTTWKMIGRDKVMISPIPANSTQAAMIYSTQDDDIYLDNNIWIRQFTLAKAKKIVGTVRSKFTMPSPTGGEITLDGATLYAQGQAEEEMLFQQLKDNNPVGEIVIG